MNTTSLDVPVCVGLCVIGIITVTALVAGLYGGATAAAIPVATGAIGGISGWLARGAVTKLTTADATVTTKDPAS